MEMVMMTTTMYNSTTMMDAIADIAMATVATIKTANTYTHTQ